jgi:hypothetical protein
VTQRFDVPALEHRGFVGFVRAREMYLDRCASVPSEPGVYAVLRTSSAAPEILARSKGGQFKSKDPTIAVGVLRDRLIRDTPLLYIGKGDDLRRRLRQLLDFGNGKPVGHYGGRALWQLADSDDYLIAWRPVSDPRAAETELLSEFEAAFGALPFANLMR